MLVAGLVDVAAIDCIVWDDVAVAYPELVAALHIVPTGEGGMSHMRFPTQVGAVGAVRVLLFPSTRTRPSV